MPDLGQPYNPEQHKPRETFVPSPAGWYAMQAIKTEVKRTRDQRGQYLEIIWEMLEDRHPDRKGRRAWTRLNLWNPSTKAVEISQNELHEICKAIGQREGFTDSDVILRRPLLVKLTIREADGRYDASNDVGEYDHINAARDLVPDGVAPGGPLASPPAAVAGPTQPTLAPPPGTGAQRSGAAPTTDPKFAPQAPPPAGQPEAGGAPPWQQPPQQPQA